MNPMDEVISDYADQMGIRDPELLQKFLAMRVDGSIRKEMEEDIGRSQRTLHEWEKKLQDLSQEELAELYLAHHMKEMEVFSR